VPLYPQRHLWFGWVCALALRMLLTCALCGQVSSWRSIVRLGTHPALAHYLDSPGKRRDAPEDECVGLFTEGTLMVWVVCIRVAVLCNGHPLGHTVTHDDIYTMLRPHAQVVGARAVRAG
jgi:hypothetical protein